MTSANPMQELWLSPADYWEPMTAVPQWSHSNSKDIVGRGMSFLEDDSALGSRNSSSPREFGTPKSGACHPEDDMDQCVLLK